MNLRKWFPIILDVILVISNIALLVLDLFRIMDADNNPEG